MEETKMNAAITSASDQLHPSHRYQVYRQQRAGYYTIGLQTDTAADAVQAFLDTRPAFEGGTIRLWDRGADLLMAAAEWDIETTRMGFTVRTRRNVFHDEGAAVIARDIAQREALVQALAEDLRMSA
jgi:hypothetical protein